MLKIFNISLHSFVIQTYNFFIDIPSFFFEKILVDSFFCRIFVLVTDYIKCKKNEYFYVFYETFSFCIVFIYMKYNINEFKKELYKPKEIGKYLGVCNRTVGNYCKRGFLNEIRLESDRRVITRESLISYLEKNDMIEFSDLNNRIDTIYARVSTHNQANRGDLDRQIDYIKSYCATTNPKELTIFKDIGSGLNDNRKELHKLLSLIMNDKVDRLFINYKDRLTRFGYNYLKAICKQHNTTIIIVSNELTPKTIQEELAEDLCAIIRSFSGKLYGLRSKMKEKIKQDINNLL